MLSIADDRAGIVATPEGPARATHVHQVPNGSVIRDVDNKTTEVIHEGKVILTVINENEMREQRGIGHDWLEYAIYPPPENEVSDLSVTGFDAYWKVPSSPPYPDAEAVDFLFPAIQDEYHNYPKTIIQPVLEWNYEGSGEWTVASWRVYQEDEDPDHGESYRSDPIPVGEGDPIYGTMIFLSAEHSPCWAISICNNDTHESTTAAWQTDRTDELWIFAALEGWHIGSNDDVPGTTSFYDILVRDWNGNDITDDIPWRDMYGPEANNTLTDLKVRRYSEPDDDCPQRTIILETGN